ncbi:hypothetical protein [Chitinophaga barathri]|uniref:Uncharacterized protein n=1 Tax=Chitinophaga barathri TaxID=1647451 RepID=A0A3N4MGW5_9BACT|nr:hypothetical protein [Chitinophaga barathri]RPD41266.1 hypothetical protein EG028_11350 [Chitinophaga barathri]
MKKTHYFIPVICVFLTFCSEKEQVPYNVRLQNDADSMSLVLSKSSQFTSVNNSDVSKFRFRHFADVEKLIAKLPENFSKKIYIEKISIPDLEKMNTSRTSSTECTEDGNGGYEALSPYYESGGDNYSVEALRAGPPREYKVEAIVKTLNPFFDYLIRYNLADSENSGSLKSNGHTVGASGLNPLNCISITDVGGIDELVEPSEVFTWVSWTSNLKLGIGTLSVPLGIRIRAAIAP